MDLDLRGRDGSDHGPRQKASAAAPPRSWREEGVNIILISRHEDRT